MEDLTIVSYKDQTNRRKRPRHDLRKNVPLGSKWIGLTVIEQLTFEPKSASKFRCRCDCGNECVVKQRALGRTKTCGCSRKLHLDRIHALVRRPPGEAAWTATFQHCRQAAKKLGRTWDLTLERFREICLQPCSYCGSPPLKEMKLPKKYNGTIRRNGVDRIDPSGGYTEGNMCPSCWPCNRMKGSLSVTEFKAQALKIARMHQGAS
jgi:hypothetical protein